MNNDIKKNIRRIFWLLIAMFALAVIYLGRFILIDSPEIVNNPFNPRLRLMTENVARGQITDSAGVILAETAADGSRLYPFGRTLAHLVGTDQMGRSGVEARYNVILRQPSMEIIQRVMSLPDPESGRVAGDTAALTVDIDIQQTLYQAFGDNRGAAVVMEPSTGRILAMVSKPDFDPARIAADWERLIEDVEGSPLLNRATQGLYPPGSVFKSMTAAAALDSGLAEFIFECVGVAEFDGESLRCFNSVAHGTIGMPEAFAVSCNGYFAAVALEMGAGALYKACERAFFNNDLSYSIERGRSSFVLTSGASVVDIMHTAIGQGQTLVTPLHMCMVTSAIANGGRMMTPYILGKRVSATGTVLSRNLPEKLTQVFDGDAAAAITGMMIEAVESGTAAPAAVAGIAIAAKTGTAQNASGDDHGWVIAFAPADDPQIAIAVVTENSGGPRLGLELVRKVVASQSESFGEN